MTALKAPGSDLAGADHEGVDRPGPWDTTRASTSGSAHRRSCPAMSPSVEHGQSIVGGMVGVVDVLQEGNGKTVRASHPDYLRAPSAARAALGEDRFAELRDAGRTMSLSAAVAEALTVTASPAPIGGAIPDRPHDLTSREVEVLRLVVDGLSDREIAERLFVSPRTAAHHVGSILGKLGVPSRAAAAVWAVRQERQPPA